jgi:hypothetical protein
MRVLKLIFAVVCVVGLTQLVWSQNQQRMSAGPHHSYGIPGYFDPQTRTFTTGAETESSPATTTGTYYSGTIKIVLTLHVASAFP